MSLLPIEMLRTGERGRIHELDGREQDCSRLEEIGLRIGALVRMVKPGSPCIVAVDDQRLSFRSDELSRILVETTE